MQRKNLIGYIILGAIIGFIGVVISNQFQELDFTSILVLMLLIGIGIGVIVGFVLKIKKNGE